MKNWLNFLFVINLFFGINAFPDEVAEKTPPSSASDPIQEVKHEISIPDQKITSDSSANTAYFGEKELAGLFSKPRPISKTPPKGTSDETTQSTSDVNWTNVPNAPSGSLPHKKGSIYFTGEALLWRASENGLEFGSITQITSSSTIQEIPISIQNDRANLFHPHFQCHWGFRIAAGYTFDHDEWDCCACWTRFQPSANRVSLAVVDPTLTPLFTLWVDPRFYDIFSFDGDAPQIFVVSADGQWRVHLDVLDMEMGRKFFLGKWLTFRPFAGLRAGRILQDYNQQILGTGFDAIPPPNVLNATDYLKMTNNFRGIGVLSGLESQWGLFKEVSLYGNATLSLLFGGFQIYRRDVVEGNVYDPTQTILIQTAYHNIETKDHFTACRAIFDLALGLKWDHLFVDHKYHLGLNIGWEEHLFIGQNQFLPHPITFSMNTDLSIHGWAFGGRFDF